MLTDRIREIASDNSMNLKEFSDMLGVSYRTLQNYLSEKSHPNVLFLERLNEKTGVSSDWLIFGRGSKYASDQNLTAVHEVPSDFSDHARLQLAIEAVEEGLDAFERVASPKIKAGLIAAAYELLEQEGEGATAQIIRLVKMA